MFIYIAIFLIVAAIAISNVAPESKGEVWRSSIFIPISFAVIASLILAAFSGNTAFFLYRFGAELGRCIPSIIVSSLVIFFCLKYKFEHEDNYKYPKGIFVAIIICFLIGSIQIYMAYLSNKALDRYLNEELGMSIDYQDEESAFNKSLPEDMGNGFIMMNYDEEQYKRIFTIQCVGKQKSDFDNHNIANLKETFINQIKQRQFSQYLQDIFIDSQNKGFDMLFNCQNEKNDDLFTFTILPYELE